MNGNLENLAKYGTAGIAIALIVLLYIVLNMFFGFVGDITASLNNNTEVLGELKRVIQEDKNLRDQNASLLEALSEKIDEIIE